MSAAEESLRRSMDDLVMFLIGGTTVADALHHVAEHTVEAVQPAAFAGVTMIVDGRTRTGVFTDPLAPEIDAAQYETGEGPCIQAFHDGTAVTITSMRTELRFPTFCRVALAHGIASTLSLPLVAGDARLGALNLYARTEAAFDEESAACAKRFVAQASVVLANAQSYASSVTLNDQLRTAMVSRETIDLARGIIIGTTGCSPEDAFRRLVHQSQHQNRKLRDVAAGIVRGAGRRPSAG